MLPSEKLAIAAHLHVLLRRKTGRVTDTEWMARNADYAAEIVRFCRARALEDGAPDLAEWAGKLEQAVLQAPAAAPSARPLAQAAWQAVRAQPRAPEPSTAAEPQSGADPSTLPSDKAPANVAPRYVGGIR